MLWTGQVLFGMMMFDEFRAFDYLAQRPEVDSQRLGVLGIFLAPLKHHGLAALDPRVRLCMDVCCLTDYEELIKAQSLSEHGIYYYVPSLLKHFQAADMTETIVPRPRLSVNGRRDPLTPVPGVDKIRSHLMPLYRRVRQRVGLSHRTVRRGSPGATRNAKTHPRRDGSLSPLKLRLEGPFICGTPSC